MAFDDPFSDLDQFGGLTPRRRRRRSQLRTMTPAEEESLLATVGHKALSGLATVGNVLDTPGAIVRGVLAGENPLPGILDPERRTTGRDVLERWGMLSPNQPGFDAGDVAGFAADLALDPLSYLTLGGSALSKGGQALKAAGTLKGMNRVGRLTSSIDDVLQAATPAMQQKIATAAAGQGLDLAKAGSQKVGGLIGIGLPFREPAFAVGTGPAAQKVAGGLDAIGHAARWGNLPGTQYSPGRHVAALFNGDLADAMTEPGQRMAQAIADLRAERGVESRALGGELASAAHDAGLLAPADRDALRGMFEGSNLVTPELQPVVGKVEAELARLRSRAKDLGLGADELDDLAAKYFPRHKATEAGAMPPRQSLVNSALDESQNSRLEAFKHIVGGTGKIKEIARDPMVNQIIDQGGDANLLKAWIEHAHAAHFVKPENIEEFASILHAMPAELRKAGIFANDPVADLERHLLSRNNAVSAAEGTLDALAQSGVLRTASAANGGHRGTTSVGDLFAKIGLETGDENAGAVKQLADRLGQPFPKRPQDLLEMRVPDDLAGDVVRYWESFKSPEAVHQLLQAADSATNLTKAGLTGPWPSFQTRNQIGGLFQNWLMGHLNVRSMQDAFRMLRGGAVEGAEEIPAVKEIMLARGLSGDEAATDVLRQLIRSHEVVGKYEGETANAIGDLGNLSPRTAADVGAEFAGGLGGSAPFSFKTMAKKYVGRAEGTNLNPIDVRGVNGRQVSRFGPVAAGEDAGYLVEGMNRISPFISMLREGVDPAQAAAKIGAAHVLYAGKHYSALERDVLARLFPFYKFSSRQLPWTIQQLIERPGGKLAQSIKAANRMRGESAVPDQISDTAAIPIPEGVPLVGAKPGGDPRYLTGFGLMPEDPLQFAGGGLRGAGLELLGRLNPALKGALEYSTGQTFFQKGPHGGRPLEDLDPLVGRLLANASGRKNAVHYPGESVLEPLLANSPASRLLSSLRTASDTRKTALTKLVNLGTGFRLTDVPVGKREALLREQAQEELRSLPGARDFVDTYLPEERFAELPPAEQLRATRARAALNILAKRAKQRKKERLAGAGKL